jgi:hypothetical protein
MLQQCDSQSQAKQRSNIQPTCCNGPCHSLVVQLFQVSTISQVQVIITLITLPLILSIPAMLLLPLPLLNLCSNAAFSKKQRIYMYK